VQVGDSWQGTYAADFAGGGQLTEQVTTTLTALDATTAHLSSDLHYAIPDFDADNPLLPGAKMRVRNAVLDITGLTQDYVLATSVVREAHGKMTVSLDAVSPEMTLKIKIAARVNFLPCPGA